MENPSRKTLILILILISFVFTSGFTPTVMNQVSGSIDSSILWVAPTRLNSENEDNIEITSEDKTKSLYRIYKNGQEIYVSNDLQYWIRDISQAFNFDERYVFGLIINESTFDPNAEGDNGRSVGLGQIQSFWLWDNPSIVRYKNNNTERDLRNPYQNIVTILEIFHHIREQYDLDTNTEYGMRQLLFVYGTGKPLNEYQSLEFIDNMLGYAAELVKIEY